MKSIATLSKVLIAMAVAMQAHHTCAQNTPASSAANNFLKKRTDAFMTITGYSLTPDVTTGSLSITDKGGNSPNLQMISLGGGDRISAGFPLYL